MMIDKERARYLLERYHSGYCTPEERAEFAWFLHDPKFDELRREMLDSHWPANELEELEEPTQEVLSTILTNVKKTPRTKAIRFLPRFIPYAAAIILIALVGTVIIYNVEKPTDSRTTVGVNDVQPGSNRATLKLSDGRIINLSEGQSGVIINDVVSYLDGTAILDNEALTTTDTDGAGATLPINYQFSTPKGGTYQIILPDGSRVWLNAGSVLDYSHGAGSKHRQVRLAGEAYFSVKHVEPNVPFLVHTDRGTVEVLGTQFNLSAYAEENGIKTTLVEGSVKFSSPSNEHPPVILTPGQQSVYSAGAVAVNNVDVGPFIAWKDGYFDFQYTPFSEAISQISRWYDVQPVYKGKIPTETFSGKISRNVTLKSVLKFFEGSDIQIELADGKLIIAE